MIFKHVCKTYLWNNDAHVPFPCGPHQSWKGFCLLYCFFMLMLHDTVSVKTKSLYNLSVSTTRGLSIMVNEMGALLTSNLTDISTSSSVGEETSLLTSRHCCLSSIVFSATAQTNPLPPVYTTTSMASVCKWSSLCIVRHVSLDLNISEMVWKCSSGPRLILF